MKIKLLLLMSFAFFQMIHGQRANCFAKKRMCDRRMYIDANDKVAFDEETATYLLKSDYRTRFEGTCETCYRNNVLMERITVKNGKREGSDTSFFKSGCIQSIQSHSLGVKNGIFLVFYDSTGRIKFESNYLLGKKNGQFLEFEANGDSVLNENFINDLKSGEQRLYYEKGKIGKVVNYQNGLLNGSHKTFSVDGKLEIELYYKAGKNHGTWKYFHLNGKEAKIETWNNGLKDGLFLLKDDKGALIKQESFKKNIPEGEFIENYSNGKPKHLITYKAGEVIREQRIDDYGKTTYTFDKALNKAKEKENKKKAKTEAEDDDIQDAIDEKGKKGKKEKN